ncbi:MAG: protein kinase, partial [Deltaproteobacteria bacterium]|nr:protein kinase [Deltaproteobacteria bacterium]
MNDPLVGAVVADKYRVIDLVARGGMGRIYRAEQAPLGREVALKILTRPVLGTNLDDVALEKRFLLEAATCARLRHPNTVTVFDYGAIDIAGEQTFYMVMEFVRGRTVSQAIRAEGPFSPARTVRVAHEICRSLREAHRAGIVHRDLKPSNVMLAQTEEGEAVKVLDFGVAKVMAEGAESLTTDGSFVGSPRYTAPEQVRQEQIDGRADLYALGVMMFEMLSGAPPFSSSEPVRTLLMHLNDPVPALHGPEGVPAPIEALVRRLLEKDPRARYADADAVILALRATRLLPVSELPEATVDLPLEDDSVTEDKPAVASRTWASPELAPGPVDTRLPTSPTVIGSPEFARALAGAQARPEPAAPVVAASPSPAPATGRWLA